MRTAFTLVTDPPVSEIFATARFAPLSSAAVPPAKARVPLPVTVPAIVEPAPTRLSVLPPRARLVPLA